MSSVVGNILEGQDRVDQGGIDLVVIRAVRRIAEFQFREPAISVTGWRGPVSGPYDLDIGESPYFVPAVFESPCRYSIRRKVDKCFHIPEYGDEVVPIIGRIVQVVIYDEQGGMVDNRQCLERDYDKRHWSFSFSCDAGESSAGGRKIRILGRYTRAIQDHPERLMFFSMAPK